DAGRDDRRRRRRARRLRQDALRRNPRQRPPLLESARWPAVITARTSKAMNATTYVKDFDTGEQTGLDQIKFFQAGGLNYKGIGHHLGFERPEAEEGRVVFAATPTEASYNPLGTVHGGYIATLLDSALGCAVHTTLKPRLGYTTLELKINYLRPLTSATGRI